MAFAIKHRTHWCEKKIICDFKRFCYKYLRWLALLKQLLLSLPTKQGASFFFYVIQLLFWNTGFIFDVSEGFIKKYFALPGKTFHKKQLLPVEHFLLSRAPTSHNDFKKNELKLTKRNVHKLDSLQRMFRFFLILFITNELLINLIHRIFVSDENRNSFRRKPKRRKVEHPFVDEVFNYHSPNFKNIEAT